jgi:hypothetical protein
VQLEEPAWFILKNLHSNRTTEEISIDFAGRYHITTEESLRFVEEMIAAFTRLKENTFQQHDQVASQEIEPPDTFFAVRSYLINEKSFEICYGSRRIEYMIHPSFAHLEKNVEGEPDFRIEAFASGDHFVLHTAGIFWREENVNYLKRKLFIELTNLMYGKTADDWLTYIHGSAVSNGKEAVVLTTSSGSGKSTLAGLLCSRGLKFFADDFVPIDNESCLAYPFPAALSVKEGAFPLLLPFYENLKKAKRYEFRGTGKSVRYLPFPEVKNGYQPLPVRSMVFVHYNSSAENSFKKVTALEAIRRFNEEAWIAPSIDNANTFLEWFPELNFYELIYSENEVAIKDIFTLFDSRE